ncbi:MAG: hypothetical protein E6K55_11550 [Gemmatimonadetes bacterium]|nr:MAG: hypothetical protein E6K55_11550 [Gemmatimonadota bacterium]
MKRLVLIVGLLVLPAVAAAQTQCVKGKPCGRTCIADNKTCHVERPAYVPAAAAESAPPDTARAEPGEGMPWVASSRGEVYYRRGCGNANRLVPENRVYFRTEEDAKRAGYRRSGSPRC